MIDDDFNGPNGLIASEGQSAGPWEITSGSLFRDNGTGWTGKPDDSTGSAVFRMASLSHSFNNANMTLLLRVDDLVTTHRTPRQDYDGVHIWVGYQSRVRAVRRQRRPARRQHDHQEEVRRG